MASSLSKSRHVSCNTFHVIFFVFLLVGSCTATRPGVMVMVDRKSTVNSEHMKTLPENQRFEALAYFHHPPPPTMSALSPLPTSLPSHRDGLSLTNLKVVSEVVGILTGIVLLIVTIYNCTRSRNASNDGVQTIDAPSPSTLPGDNDTATTKGTNHYQE